MPSSQRWETLEVRALVPACSAIISSWKREGDTVPRGEAARAATGGWAGRAAGVARSVFSARNLCTDLQLTQMIFSGMPSVMERIRCRVSPLHRPQGASKSWPA